jgi:hypothetical protein
VAALPQIAPQLLGVALVLKAAEAIVTVPPDDDLSPGMPAAPRRGPEVTGSVERAMRQQGAGTAPWRRPFLLRSPRPLLPHAGLEPLADVADDALGPQPGLDNLHPPCVVQRLVKTPHVGIASPGAVALCTPSRDRRQRLGRVTAGAGPRRAPKTCFLLDGVEPLDGCPLDEVLFPRRFADGALAPVSLRHGDACDRGGRIRPPLQAL